MVSFWPWRGDDSSTASFEKALSTLSSKINNTQAQLERTRSTSRRVKVLWTLYLSFAYLVYAIVLVLVVGWNNMGPWEWSGVAGGPILIYVTRTVLAAFFNFRIDTLSTRLKDQQAERARTVQKLKDATKYDSTLELLEKYGGEPKRGRGRKAGAGAGAGGEGEADGEEGQEGGGKQKPGQAQGIPGSRKVTPGRTGLVPPPTANIPRGSMPGTPEPGRGSQLPPSPQQPYSHRRDPSADFAPNAFGPGDAPPPPSVPNAHYAPAPAPSIENHWYDRIMDLLLGEDETAAKNRIVLICGRCKLVNGQAPPGTKNLADIGMWRCMGCGAMNGEEADEGRRIVNQVLKERGATTTDQSHASSGSTDGDFKAMTDEDSSDIVRVFEKGADSESDGGARKRKGKGKK